VAEGVTVTGTGVSVGVGCVGVSVCVLDGTAVVSTGAGDGGGWVTDGPQAARNNARAIMMKYALFTEFSLLSSKIITQKRIFANRNNQGL